MRRQYVDKYFYRILAYDSRLIKTSVQAGKSKVDRRPCVYMFEFVDRYGQSPTVKEMREILDMMKQYLEDDDYACEVDHIDKDKHEADWDAYHGGDGNGGHWRPLLNKGVQSDVRWKKVRHFMQSLKDWLDQHGNSDTMALPIREVSKTPLAACMR